MHQIQGDRHRFRSGKVKHVNYSYACDNYENTNFEQQFFPGGAIQDLTNSAKHGTGKSVTRKRNAPWCIKLSARRYTTNRYVKKSPCEGAYRSRNAIVFRRQIADLSRLIPARKSRNLSSRKPQATNVKTSRKRKSPGAVAGYRTSVI